MIAAKHQLQMREAIHCSFAFVIFQMGGLMCPASTGMHMSLEYRIVLQLVLFFPEASDSKNASFFDRCSDLIVETIPSKAT